MPRLRIAFLLSCLPALAFAQQADIERAIQASQRLLLEEQQRQAREREELERRRPRSEGADLQAQPPAPAAPSGCFPIREVQLDGATLLADAERQRLIAPGVGDCINLTQINAVMQGITNHYLVRGYTTTRVYLPEQDLGSGTLRLLVLEGLIEQFRLDGEGVNLDTAFPGLRGRLFNLRDIEQGLDQINRLRSNSATMDIEPGGTPGASQIVVRNRPRKRWSVNAALDNTGSQSTGRELVSAALAIDGPLGLNDFLNLSGRINTDADHDDKLSQSVSLLYSIPYGYWTFTLTASEFDYASRVRGSVVSFNSSGQSTLYGLRVDRVLFRDRDAKVSLFGNLGFKDSRNYLNDTLLETSSRQLATLDLGVSASTVLSGVLLSGDIAWVQGLDAFGALKDAPGQDSAAPRAQFDKVVLNASAAVSLPVAGRTLALSSTLSAQRSTDTLYGTEQFFIGGPFSVRGFRRYSIAGDSGAWLRNEVALPLQWGEARLRPFLGWDIGHIRADEVGPGGTLAGFTVGIGANLGALAMQLALSAPTALPARLGNHDSYAQFRVAMDF
ncbi:ShlB/FhaC/HecB family hemolysin secretion/activation protein [Methyloversatilis thermotolerans]|uniref:ShlB/FhaC/HecB family hemolysin secretion/activation protein n=1 Tax=Methyloversatilis thermotolerans TaxID=1346290 RepID=UPI00037752E6|nr:ShlB/FhaC/HecB family hemolysin secretion/activation protein [Methyloversatilis thermotolerans]